MGVLSDNIYHVSKTHNDEAIESDELIQPNLCSSCFKEYTYLTDPLDINHFNVSREWLLHVPLPVQIQLEHTYISKDVKNAVSIEQVKPKISALYCQFEAHLKTLNQSYGGIIQDIYTDELLVNYHNISTVFSLTSHAGISHSQRTGDRRLRKNADPEICYYHIQANVTVDVDSEAVYGQCECEDPNNCGCSLFTIPVRAVFTQHAGVSGIRKLDAIRQRKGEAEMSQADWLRDVRHDLHDGECVMNYVTSADIDTIVIQLFTVSLYWPRNVDNTFKFPVYVWLQKQKPEIYDITGILTVLEKRFGNKYIGATLAVLLSMGGNDYLPNFHGISNEKLLTTALSEPVILSSLLKFEQKTDPRKVFVCTLDMEQYVQLYTKLH
ncbi:Hypothetical predicted protein [Mytilus galloprovincialis]|uniref:Uncharacterized protein n=1 Tax=Mytilus galloprovincialis TaxID=29158 RepID=A0A8B6F6T1_MYTGA|nr:Hypothetical predicted protein [Mytilus galloprovincialis]